MLFLDSAINHANSRCTRWRRSDGCLVVRAKCLTADCLFQFFGKTDLEHVWEVLNDIAKAETGNLDTNLGRVRKREHPACRSIYRRPQDTAPVKRNQCEQC